MWKSNIAPERWHNSQQLSSATLYQTYGTPGAWYRRSFHSVIAKANVDGIRDHAMTIRAAAIFKSGVPLTPLTVDTTYALVCDLPQKDWKIIMVSTANAERWLERAYECGALAWWLSDPGPVFEYVPLVHPDPREETDSVISDTPRGAGRYDREQVIRDLQTTRMTQQEIANRHGITRSMVNLISRQLRDKIDPTASRKKRTVTQLDPALIPLISRDIINGRMNKQMIAAKHNITPQKVTNLIEAYGLAGYLPRGHTTAQLERKYNKNKP